MRASEPASKSWKHAGIDFPISASTPPRTKPALKRDYAIRRPGHKNGPSESLTGPRGTSRAIQLSLDRDELLRRMQNSLEALAYAPPAQPPPRLKMLISGAYARPHEP